MSLRFRPAHLHLPPDEAHTLAPVDSAGANSSTAPVAPHAPHAPEPRVSSPIIGREADLADLRRLLLRADIRVVTLSGPSGIGRTRLALLLRDDSALRAAFPLPPAWVDLGQAATTEPAVALLARALGITPHLEGVLLEQVVEQLQSQRRLLLLDDIDSDGHTEGARELVAHLLRTCPGLTLVLISHRALGVAGEYEHRLQPLAVPAERDWATLSEAERGAAIDLFVQRAQHLVPDFAPTIADTIAIARVCRLLGGLPAAVELAAAQVRNLTPRELLAHLSRRAPADAILDAEQALTMVVSWSADLCGTAQQVAFRRLAIFPAGFDAALASATGAANGTDLTALTTRGLLEDLPGGRYRLREPLRQIALQRLLAAGLDEVQRIHAAQADWYLDWSAQAQAGMRGPQQSAWVHQFSTDLGNIRVALEWLASDAADRHADGLRMAVALVHAFARSGQTEEGRRWLQRATQPTEHSARSPLTIPAHLHAEALNEESWLAVLQGDSTSAEQLALASLHIQDTALEQERGTGQVQTPDVNALDVRASTLDSLGELAFSRGDFALARTRLTDSLATWQAQGDARSWHAAMTRISLGNAALNAGDHDAAEDELLAAEAALTALNDSRAAAIATLSRAWLALQQVDDDNAARLRPASVADPAPLDLLHRALHVFRTDGHHLETADTLEAHAAATLVLAGESSDPTIVARAAQLMGAALTLRAAHGIAPHFLARIGPQEQRRALRGRLLDDALAEERARGGSLPLDDLLHVP